MSASGSGFVRAVQRRLRTPRSAGGRPQRRPTLLTQFGLTLAARAGYRFSYAAIESSSSGAMLVPLGMVLFHSLRRLFPRPASWTVVQTVILLAWSVLVLSAYRFVLFLTTFAAT